MKNQALYKSVSSAPVARQCSLSLTVPAGAFNPNATGADYPGETTVTGRLFNFGNAAVTAAFEHRLAEYRADGTAVDVQGSGQFDDGLAACFVHGGTPAAFSWTPEDRGASATAQVQYIRYEADYTPAPDGVVTETRNDDNYMKVYATDLRFTDGTAPVSISPPNAFVPGSPAAGSTATLMLSYDVDGHMAYPDFTVMYWMQQNRSAAVWPYGTSQLCMAATQANVLFSGGTAPGSEVRTVTAPLAEDVLFPSCTVNVKQGNKTVPREVDYDVLLCTWLDAGHCVAERNEANNTTYQGNVVRDCQNIHVHVPKANLTVWRGVGASYAPHPSDITLNGLSDNGQPVNGVTMPLMAIVTNNGEATATNVRTVLRRQPFNENIGFGTPYGFSLKGGQTQTVTFNDWTPESGAYHLEAEVDFQGLVDEINENDNVATREIPELEVVDVNAKKSGE